MAESEDQEVKLLGLWASPYVLRARVALNLKGVQHEYIEDNFTAKSELLLKSNPVYKKVPVLIHGGKPVCESMIIVQYIDEVWTGAGGASIIPADAYERAKHRFWAVYVDDKLFPSLLGVMTSQTDDAKAEAKEQAEAGLQLLEDAFGKMSKGKAFFRGDTIGYFDIALGSFVGLIKTIEELDGFKLLDDAKTPLLSAWAENFCHNEAVQSVLPETVKLVELARVFQLRRRSEPTPAK